MKLLRSRLISASFAAGSPPSLFNSASRLGVLARSKQFVNACKSPFFIAVSMLLTAEAGSANPAKASWSFDQ